MMGPLGGEYKKKKGGEGKGLGTKIKGKENTKENGVPRMKESFSLSILKTQV